MRASENTSPSPSTSSGGTKGITNDSDITQSGRRFEKQRAEAAKATFGTSARNRATTRQATTGLRFCCSAFESSACPRAGCSEPTSAQASRTTFATPLSGTTFPYRTQQALVATTSLDVMQRLFFWTLLGTTATLHATRMGCAADEGAVDTGVADQFD